MKTSTFLAIIAVISLTVACGSDPAQHPAPAPMSADNSTPSPTQPQSAPRRVTTSAGIPPITAEGWGPLRVGMSRAQITRALGPDANPDAVGGADPAQCDQFRPARAPEGMLVMVEDGLLSRISLINNSRVKTDRDLGLGATPAAVREAYGPAILAEPHKYEGKPAQYLTFWSKGGGAEGGPVASSSRGIRYEINGTGRVAMIHAGGPSIAYVEGCS